jgi:hypothetical protein
MLVHGLSGQPSHGKDGGKTTHSATDCAAAVSTGSLHSILRWVSDIVPAAAAEYMDRPSPTPKPLYVNVHDDAPGAEHHETMHQHRLSLQAGITAATAAASASILLGVLPQLPPPAVQAITNEQLLYLEAWRAVDRAYVDKSFNGNSWFRVGEQSLGNAQTCFLLVGAWR